MSERLKRHHNRLPARKRVAAGVALIAATFGGVTGASEIAREPEAKVIFSERAADAAANEVQKLIDAGQPVPCAETIAVIFLDGGRLPSSINGTTEINIVMKPLIYGDYIVYPGPNNSLEAMPRGLITGVYYLDGDASNGEFTNSCIIDTQQGGVVGISEKTTEVDGVDSEPTVSAFLHKVGNNEVVADYQRLRNPQEAVNLLYSRGYRSIEPIETDASPESILST